MQDSTFLKVFAEKEGGLLAKRWLFAFSVIALSLVFIGGTLSCSKREEGKTQGRPLRLLAWVGYDEPDFLKLVEERVGRGVEVKTYVGGDQMYNLYTSAPKGTYDVVVVDAEYGKRMFDEGLLRPLPREEWYSSDLFEPFATGVPARVGDNVFAAVVRWGALGLVYNKDHLTDEDVASYAILLSPKVRGKVGVFDWYLPTMGVLSLSLGNGKPFDLSKVELEVLSNYLAQLRPQVATIHPNTGDVISDLRSGEAWVTPGIGEWAAAVLEEEGRPIDWIIPKEGGVMWVEALAIPSSARDPQLSALLLEAIKQNNILAALSWRKAYHSQVTRRGAYPFLSSTQRQILKANDLDELQNLLSRLIPRRLPGPQTTEAEWLRVWAKFKAGNGH